MDGTENETNLMPTDLLSEDIECQLQINSYFDTPNNNPDQFLNKIKAFQGKIDFLLSKDPSTPLDTQDIFPILQEEQKVTCKQFTFKKEPLPIFHLIDGAQD